MNLYIKQIMIKLERGSNLNVMKGSLKECLERFDKLKEFSGVRVIIDVDPV